MGPTSQQAALRTRVGRTLGQGGISQLPRILRPLLGRSWGGAGRRTLASWPLTTHPVSSSAISPHTHPLYHIKFLKRALKTAPVIAQIPCLSKAPPQQTTPLHPPSLSVLVAPIGASPLCSQNFLQLDCDFCQFLSS